MLQNLPLVLEKRRREAVNGFQVKAPLDWQPKDQSQPPSPPPRLRFDPITRIFRVISSDIPGNQLRLEWTKFLWPLPPSVADPTEAFTQNILTASLWRRPRHRKQASRLIQGLNWNTDTAVFRKRHYLVNRL